MLSRNKMKSLIDEIIEIGNELKRYYELEEIHAKANSAPPKAAIKAFDERFSGKIPPSYIQLMSIYNGIENFEWDDVSILPIEFLMKNDDLEEDWVDAGVFEKGDLFVFAQSNSDALAVAFLIKTGDEDDEMEVIHFDAGGTLGKYKNLSEYLRARHFWFKESLEKEKADRAGLTDDE